MTEYKCKDSTVTLYKKRKSGICPVCKAKMKECEGYKKITGEE